MSEPIKTRPVRQRGMRFNLLMSKEDICLYDANNHQKNTQSDIEEASAIMPKDIDEEAGASVIHEPVPIEDAAQNGEQTDQDNDDVGHGEL